MAFSQISRFWDGRGVAQRPPRRPIAAMCRKPSLIVSARLREPKVVADLFWFRRIRRPIGFERRKKALTMSGGSRN